MLSQLKARPSTQTLVPSITVPLHNLVLTGTPAETKQNSVLAYAVRADVIRRVKAICECELWQMEKDRALTYRDGTAKCYPVNVATGKCTCPDAVRVESIKRRMRSATVHTTLNDKHHYIRQLHAGITLYVYDPGTDLLVVSASLKPGQSKPTVVISDLDAYARLLKMAYELTETELDRAAEGDLN